MFKFAVPCPPYPDPDPEVEARRTGVRKMMGPEWQEVSPGYFTTDGRPRRRDPLGDSLIALARLESLVAESIDDVARNDEARRLVDRLGRLVKEIAAAHG